MAKKLDKITPRSENFSQWYTDIVKNADLMEYGPVKGTIIFKPYGYAIWELIQKFLDNEFKKSAVSNVYLPLLIPKSLFLKEQQHIEGFAPELATVTHVGDKQLEDPLYIRPTSEVLFANLFNKEIRSWRDLPKVYNQWVNVMRWEKTTRPFLRSSEFLWQEGHTMHESEHEAKELTLKMLDIYANFAKNILSIPVIKGKKTEMEKFAGAEETYTIEAIMYDGQALQCGTSHYLGDNFSKVYDIEFQNKAGQLENPKGTSWGVSTRLIGAIIMTHSDDSGLVIPFKISPIQISIINVKDTEEIKTVALKIKNELVTNEYRVFIDNTDKSFGYKMAESEIKGVPIRIEIGPKDLEEGVVTISRRDDSVKHKVVLNEVLNEVNKMVSEYDKQLFENANKRVNNFISTAQTIDEYEEIIKTKSGFVLVPFCGDVSCEEEIKKRTSTNSRCIPFNEKEENLKCFKCGKETNLKVYFARSY